MWVMGWWVGVLPAAEAPTPAFPARMYLVSQEQPLSPRNVPRGRHILLAPAPSRHLQVMGGQGAGPLGCSGCSLQQQASGAHVGDGHCPPSSRSAHPRAPEALRDCCRDLTTPSGSSPAVRPVGDT